MAFESLCDACQSYGETKGKFIKMMEKSRWFKLINRILKKAFMIQQALTEVT